MRIASLTVTVTRSGSGPGAKRTATRRIALIGDGLKLETPVFYRSPEGTLTIDWPQGAEHPRE